MDNDDGAEPDQQSEVPLLPSDKSTSHKQSTPARKKKPVTKNTTDERSEEIYSMIKSVHQDRQERRWAQPDDFDVFGEIVARKLCNLPTRYAQITLQHQINILLYEAELGKYNEPPQTSQVHRELSQYVRLPSVSPASSSISQTYSNPPSVQSYAQLSSVQSLPNTTYLQPLATVQSTSQSGMDFTGENTRDSAWNEV